MGAFFFSNLRLKFADLACEPVDLFNLVGVVTHFLVVLLGDLLDLGTAEGVGVEATWGMGGWVVSEHVSAVYAVHLLIVSLHHT